MAQHDGISQISPKSSNNEPAALSIESTKSEASYELPPSPLQSHSQLLENETRARVERSASPILHAAGLNDVNYVEESEKDVSAGRYFHYNIKPTGTYEQEQDQPERTSQRARAGKTLAKSKTSSSTISTEGPFLVQGDLRPPTSGSPISPSPSSTASSTLALAASATQAPHSARQNGNPDIQDIITGIVKLLNGNVNVHANTQGVGGGGVRRPSASRINNRGPPRISEVQPLPIDYEAQKPGTSMRPPPYPFDRPERPFITGVPIPEQIVPVRPGFVSNRPPWYRNKPRPPITTSVNGSRRPLPQYQPLPAAPQQQQQQRLPTRPAAAQPEQEEDPRQPGLDAVQPTDTTYDSEFSNEDANAQYIEVSDQDTDAGVEVEDELQPPPEPQPEPELVPTKEKKKHKPKKPLVGHEGPDGYTTIIETSSVVNTVMGISSSYVPMSMDNHDLDPSTEEVIFMTANRTPALEASSSGTTSTTSSSSFSSPASSSIQTMPLSESSIAVAAIVPTSKLTSTTSTTTTTSSTTTTTTTTSSTTTSTTSTTTTEASPTANAPSAPPASYHPRPGIVLDDPEFKPGGRPRPAARPAAPQQPIQPTRQHLPPGYGEIFDVTLSAIQGPGPKGSGSQQTINIKPYGSYGAGGGAAAGGGQQADIIVSASGDEGFVSIDGKRTYINLFGDPTDPPAGAATTPATRLPQLPGMATTAGGVTTSGVGGAAGGGALNHGVTQSSGGYVVPETEIVELQPQPGQGQSKPATGATTNAGPTRPHYRQRTTQPPVRIDTCIVGDDSTCDQAQHERCKTDNGVSSCHCRPGE